MNSGKPALRLEPALCAEGTLELPGSKSISNRVLLLSAVARGDTLVRSVLDADDTRVMLAALRQLGVAMEEATGGLRVLGTGGPFPVRQADLFLGNAGTAFRPLTAMLALSGGSYRLSGVQRMHERPIGDLVEALNAAGARIEYLAAHGYPPLGIEPASLRFDRPFRVRGNTSSQFLSALLMAPGIVGRAAAVEIEGELISKPYVEMTLRLMEQFGLATRREGWSRIDIAAGGYSSPGAVLVEGDASAASYFLAAGAAGGGPVTVRGVGENSIQGDVRFVEVLERMGASVRMGEGWIQVSGSGRPLRNFDLDLNHIPDAAMTAALLALFADGACRIRNIGSWRVKETDRIAAMATELRKLGARVDEGNDFIGIEPPADGLRTGVEIDTYDDHRMAMCFSLVCLAGVPVVIRDPACVAKTYPGYFEDFSRILRRK